MPYKQLYNKGDVEVIEQGDNVSIIHWGRGEITIPIEVMDDIVNELYVEKEGKTSGQKK